MFIQEFLFLKYWTFFTINIFGYCIWILVERLKFYINMILFQINMYIYNPTNYDNYIFFVMSFTTYSYNERSVLINMHKPSWHLAHEVQSQLNCVKRWVRVSPFISVSLCSSIMVHGRWDFHPCFLSFPLASRCRPPLKVFTSTDWSLQKPLIAFTVTVGWRSSDLRVPARSRGTSYM